MTETVAERLSTILTAGREAQGRAYESLLAESEGSVAWAYDAWDDLVAALVHDDNRVRSIASQLLCNLSASDPEGRIKGALAPLLRVTKDERFVTARHCLQSLWKIGLAGDDRKALLVDALGRRFAEAADEKNGTLVRFDIVQGLRHLYDRLQDESLRATAMAWIQTEADPKYRKKYAGVWKK